MFRSFKRQMITASVALLVTGAASAAKADIVIGLLEGGVPTSISTTGSATGSLNGYNFTVNASSIPPSYLFSDSIGGTEAGGGSLAIYVTQTGLTQSAMQGFLSTFTSNILPAGASILEQTFLDRNNGTFTTSGASVTALGSNTFTDFGSVQQGSNLGSIGGTFSITEVFTITEPNPGSFQATINVSAVPELSTWAMLILGFLGVGFTAYRGKAGFRFS